MGREPARIPLPTAITCWAFSCWRRSSAWSTGRFSTSCFSPSRRTFRVSDSALGLLSGLAFAIFFAALGIPIAAWADRSNRKNILALAIALWSIMTAFCGLATSFGLLIVARIGTAVGEAGGGPPTQSLISDYFTQDKRATAMSIYAMGATLGGMTGNLIGGWGDGSFRLARDLHHCRASRFARRAARLHDGKGAIARHLGPGAAQGGHHVGAVLLDRAGLSLAAPLVPPYEPRRRPAILRDFRRSGFRADLSEPHFRHALERSGKLAGGLHHVRRRRHPFGRDRRRPAQYGL